MVVKRDMTLADLLQKYPQAADIISRRGLHCIGCHVAWNETLEQGAAAHGMGDKQIDDMIAEINAAVTKAKTKK